MLKSQLPGDSSELWLNTLYFKVLEDFVHESLRSVIIPAGKVLGLSLLFLQLFFLLLVSL